MDTDARAKIESTVGDLDVEENLDLLARIGLTARGVVYLIFGIIVFNLSQ